jgi:hypothetical protein
MPLQEKTPSLLDGSALSNDQWPLFSTPQKKGSTFYLSFRSKEKLNK